MDFHRIRSPRLPFEQEYTTGGWNRESGKETCRCPSGLSSWFLVKETSIFCPGFYLRLKERMTSIKNRGHPRGYCRRDRTQLLSNFSSCNFLLKPSICSSLDGYRRGGKTFFSAWGSIIYPPPHLAIFTFPLNILLPPPLYRNRISFFQNIFAIYGKKKKRNAHGRNGNAIYGRLNSKEKSRYKEKSWKSSNRRGKKKEHCDPPLSLHSPPLLLHSLDPL